MATILRFTPPLLDAVGSQLVYLKSRWQDAWVAVPELWCSEAVWTVSPSIGTAQLRWRYGDALKQLGQQFLAYARAGNRLRQYVRIDFIVTPIHAEDDSPSVRSWYGVLDLELEALDGQFALVDENGQATFGPRGKHYFAAYGLESLLDQATISRSFVQSAGGQYAVQRALPFNPGKIGNRSQAAGEGNVYLFHGERTGGSSWSTLTAVKYLLKNATIRDSYDEQTIDFAYFDPDEITPNWDAPELVSENRTCWDLLKSLLPRQRLLSSRVEVVAGDDDTPDQVRVRPISFAGEDLVFDSLTGASFLANPDQVILALERDRGASAPTLKRSTADGFDRVRVRGAERTSTATFSFIEGTLAIGWPAELETEFEAGASGAADYPPASEIEARMFRNIQARQADKFKPVYARFVLGTDDHELVGNGETTADRVLMPSDADPDVPEKLAPADQRFLPYLPLLEGYDYTGDLTSLAGLEEVGPAPHRRLPPLVLFRRSDYTAESKRYLHVDRHGAAAQLETFGAEEQAHWSANVRVDDKDGALWIEVAGGIQELIAATDFARLPEIDPEVPADYRTMLCTLAVPWSQFAEGIYPEEPPGGLDAVRELVLLAGDQFRCDYLVPETVVALDPEDGTLQRNATGGYLRDDRDQLQALAKLAWQWYGKVRRSLSFSTSLVNNAVEVGQYVVSLGDPELPGDLQNEVGSVVTQVRLTMPLAEGEGSVAAVVPRIEYQTAFGELDVLTLRGGRR